jgi:hypothetical protein
MPKVSYDRQIIPAFSSARNSYSVTRCLSGSSRHRRAQTGEALPVAMWWTTPWRGFGGGAALGCRSGPQGTFWPASRTGTTPGTVFPGQHPGPGGFACSARAGETPKVSYDRQIIPAFSSARNSSSVMRCCPDPVATGGRKQGRRYL